MTRKGSIVLYFDEQEENDFRQAFTKENTISKLEMTFGEYVLYCAIPEKYNPRFNKIKVVEE